MCIVRSPTVSASIGVIVALESTGNADELKAFGRMVAMHIAFANPQAIDPSGLDPATVEREKNVLAAKAEGKPANVVEKIVEFGPQALTTKRSACSSSPSLSKRSKKASVTQASKRPRRKSARRSRSPVSYALRWARASTARAAISAAKSRRWPALIRTRAVLCWVSGVNALTPIAFARESAASGEYRKRTPRWLSRTTDG